MSSRLGIAGREEERSTLGLCAKCLMIQFSVRLDQANLRKKNLKRKLWITRHRNPTGIVSRTDLVVWWL